MSAIATQPPPPLGAPPPGPIPPEPPRRPWWMAKRVLLGAVGVVLLSGAASAVLARNEVSKVVAALRQNKPVKVAASILPQAASGAPETLLLVGNDERPPPKSNPGGAVLPHSNEMLLVRIDPSKPTISMLSIPRELRVPFTRLNGQLEENRINSAYTFGYEESGETTSGGVKLMVETLKKVIGITPNLVFVTNFKRFKRAVDEMGCVYMTVDKPYHHVNEPGGEQYFEINLQPGYQRLCGQEALEFVANRHESTSLIRDARDQRFLLDVKAQYGPTLFENREKFERIVGKAVETDLRSEAQVLQLLELLVESAGKPVRQVPFHVELHSTYDTATPQQIEEAAHSFLSGTAAIAPHRLHGPGAGGHHSAHGRPAAPAAPALAVAHPERHARASARDRPAPAVRRGGAALPGNHRRIRTGRGALVRHRGPRPAAVPRLCGRRRRGRTGPVLRHPGQHLDRLAAAQRPQPGNPRRLAHLQPLLRRRTPQDDRLARRGCRLLDRKHAHQQPLAAADAGDRRERPSGDRHGHRRRARAGHAPAASNCPRPRPTRRARSPKSARCSASSDCSSWGCWGCGCSRASASCGRCASRWRRRWRWKPVSARG